MVNAMNKMRRTSFFSKKRKKTTAAPPPPPAQPSSPPSSSAPKTSKAPWESRKGTSPEEQTLENRRKQRVELALNPITRPQRGLNKAAAEVRHEQNTERVAKEHTERVEVVEEKGDERSILNETQSVLVQMKGLLMEMQCVDGSGASGGGSGGGGGGQSGPAAENENKALEALNKAVEGARVVGIGVNEPVRDDDDDEISEFVEEVVEEHIGDVNVPAAMEHTQQDEREGVPVPVDGRVRTKEDQPPLESIAIIDDDDDKSTPSLPSVDEADVPLTTAAEEDAKDSSPPPNPATVTDDTTTENHNDNHIMTISTDAIESARDTLERANEENHELQAEMSLLLRTHETETHVEEARANKKKGGGCSPHVNDDDDDDDDDNDDNDNDNESDPSTGWNSIHIHSNTDKISYHTSDESSKFVYDASTRTGTGVTETTDDVEDFISFCGVNSCFD